MRLSQHFSLREMVRSQTAIRFDIDNTPNSLVIRNLEILTNEFLEPIRSAIGYPIHVTSGFRCLNLNNAVGGSKSSSHILGEAVDFIVYELKPIAVCRIIRDMNLNYDQVIYEFGEWTHLGIRPPRRKQELTAYRKASKTIYVEGIQKIKELI